MRSDKGNSIIGFAIIGVILLVFSWYNSKQAEKQQKEMAEIAAAEMAMADTTFQAAVDTAAQAVEEIAETSEEAPLYQSSYLQAAETSQEEFYTLENDKVSIKISSKGAQPSEVLIKDYYKSDSSALYLIRKNKSDFNLELNTDQWLETGDLNFALVSSTPEELVLRLQFSETAWIDAVWTLPKDEYMAGYNLHFKGMNEVLDRRSNQITLKWAVDMPRLEKGYQNERNYSAVAYRYASNSNVKTIGQRKESVKETFSSSLRWFGFQQQFFSAIILAENDFAAGTLENKFYPEENTDGDLMHSNAEMTLDIDNRSADFTIPFKLYFGPNHYPTLRKYGESFEKIIPLGGKVIGTISRYVIIPTFNWLSKSISSYGLIILILTLMIKIVISPLTWKSYSSSAKMKVLQPELQKINEKYPKKEDAMKKQQATMDLYKKAGVSMWGGCLPILLQFPILWAMFRFFPASIELRQQGFLWASDLSAYDSILDFGFKIPLYGDHLSLFALLMAISMWGYSKMTLGQQSAQTQSMPGMKFMQLWLMPIMMLFICNNLSAGLSYYYLLSNLITIAQNWAIRKWFIDEDKIYKQIALKTASKEAPKKSKFQQRLEAAYKAQQDQLKNQKK